MDTEVRGGNEKFQLGPLYDSKNPPLAAKTQQITTTAAGGASLLP